MTKETDAKPYFAADSMEVKSFVPKPAKMVAVDLASVKGSQQPKTVPIETVGTAKPPPSKND